MALTFAVAWAITADGLMVLLLLAAIARAATGAAPAERDRATLVRFVAITIALSLVFGAAGAHHAMPTVPTVLLVAPPTTKVLSRADKGTVEL